MLYSRFGIAFVNSALIASLLFATPALSSQDINQARWRLLWSYGNPGPSDEFAAAMDELAETLRQSVASYGYVIVYRGYNNPSSFFHSFNPPGVFHRHALAVRNYLSKLKNVPKERFIVVDGGMRQRFQADVWVVTEGEKPPEARPDAGPFIHETQGLYDEYILDSENECAESFDAHARLDGFAKALLREPRALGYIIAFAQCSDVVEGKRVIRNGAESYDTRRYRRCDPAGTGGRVGWAEQRSVLKLYGIPRSRVRVIDGGYRNSQMVELWVVPNGAESPKPTPTTGPRKRK